MTIQTNDKLDLLKYLIFTRGKLQHLSIELLTMGESPDKVDAAEKKLTKQINKLRANVMQDWQGNAGQILDELKALNDKAQAKIREMRSAVDKAQSLSDFLGILDKGLALVAGLVV